MAARVKRFPAKVVDAVDASKILGIRAGSEHRFIGIWVVVVQRRIFVRSWTVRPDGWFAAFLDDPRGAMEIGGRKIRVRAIRTRSERLKTAVDRAYAAKYTTPASQKYVRGFRAPRRRNATIELVAA